MLRRMPTNANAGFYAHHEPLAMIAVSQETRLRADMEFVRETATPTQCGVPDRETSLAARLVN